MTQSINTNDIQINGTTGMAQASLISVANGTGNRVRHHDPHVVQVGPVVEHVLKRADYCSDHASCPADRSSGSASGKRLAKSSLPLALSNGSLCSESSVEAGEAATFGCFRAEPELPAAAWASLVIARSRSERCVTL